MGRKRAPGPSWDERSDRLEGIRRDATTGIVIGREHQHPLAFWLDSIPMGAGLPGMTMPAEYRHLIAIHLFDNLRLPPPRDPLYRPRRDPNARRDTGIDATIWVPVGSPQEAATEDIAATPVLVHDISDYTPEQLAAMKAQIRQVEVERKLVQQSDTGATGAAP